MKINKVKKTFRLITSKLDDVISINLLTPLQK